MSKQKRLRTLISKKRSAVFFKEKGGKEKGEWKRENLRT